MNKTQVLEYAQLQRYNTKIKSWVKKLISSASDSGLPVGSIIFVAKTAAPDGYLFCNGATVSSTDYPALYAAIGTTFGGNATNFQLPDLRNQFLRGISSGTSPNTALGVKYGATVLNIGYYTSGSLTGSIPTSYGYNADSTSVTKGIDVSVYQDQKRYNYTSVTVRPANIGLLPCIKY